MRTVRRIVEDVARTETSVFRAFDATPGYLVKYSFVDGEVATRQKRGGPLAERKLGAVGSEDGESVQPENVPENIPRRKLLRSTPCELAEVPGSGTAGSGHTS